MKKNRFPELYTNNNAFPQEKPAHEAAVIMPGAAQGPAETRLRHNAPLMGKGKPSNGEAGCRS